MLSFKMKKIFLIGFIYLTSCSSTDTISINQETVIDNNVKVDWAITNEDSIVYFGYSKVGYAEIINNSLAYKTTDDSIKTEQISKFRTIHTFEDAPISLIIFGSIVAFVAINFFLLGGIKM